uniref:Uncharacterized protein n=1 Tax=Zea mays TaxID=4577 RepID=A0A804NKV6_MAIZE
MPCDTEEAPHPSTSPAVAWSAPLAPPKSVAASAKKPTRSVRLESEQKWRNQRLIWASRSSASPQGQAKERRYVMKKINLSKQNDNACAPNIGRQEEFLERYTVIQYPSFHRG